MIERLQGQAAVRQSSISESVGRKQPDSGFNELLKMKLDHTAQPQNVTFSKHARSRAEERGIEITQGLIDQLKGGMIRAQAKGAKNILAMDQDKAFIINVPNAKVITAITQDEMGESVFTNIDGAVFL